MEVTINGSAKEIAALVLEIQERQFKGPDIRRTGLCQWSALALVLREIRR